MKKPGTVPGLLFSNSIKRSRSGITGKTPLCCCLVRGFRYWGLDTRKWWRRIEKFCRDAGHWRGRDCLPERRYRCDCNARAGDAFVPRQGTGGDVRAERQCPPQAQMTRRRCDTRSLAVRSGRLAVFCFSVCKCKSQTRIPTVQPLWARLPTRTTR